MQILRDTLQSLYALTQVAAFRPHGWGLFNRTLGGFWHSFIAAAILAPVYFFMFGLIYLSQSDMATLVVVMPVEALAYAASWLAYPLFIMGICKFTHREERFFDYMVPYNWLAVIRAAALLLLPFLMLALPTAVLVLLALGVQALLIAYEYWLARVAFRFKPLGIIGLMAAGGILLLFIRLVANSMIQPYLT